MAALTSSTDSQLSLHPLCEEDFPWFLMWMTKETTSSLSLLLQTTRNSKEITIVAGIIDKRERVSLLTLYPPAFTQLRTGYPIQPGEYSIQQLQINPLLLNNHSVLFTLMECHIEYIFAELAAKKIFWEIHRLDKLHHELAAKAGFRSLDDQPEMPYMLYEYAR
jgi:hypothetical protein